MSDLELILTMLSETSTKEIARQKDAQGFPENELIAKVGGRIAGTARKEIEQETGQRVVSENNFLGSKSRISDPELLTSKRVEMSPRYSGSTPETAGRALLKAPKGSRRSVKQ